MKDWREKVIADSWFERAHRGGKGIVVAMGCPDGFRSVRLLAHIHGPGRGGMYV